MKNNLLLFFMLLTFFDGLTQDQRVIISGKVTSKSKTLENIHVINKNSKKAVITSFNGTFQLPVKENDTLLFSSVQFENKLLIIKKQDLTKMSVSIDLNITVNKINEVTLAKTENMAGALGLPNADKEPLNKLERRLNYHTEASLPIAILATLLGQRGGIEDMFYILSGKRKKDRKLKALIDRDEFDLYQSQVIQEIRKHYGDSFFIETLKVPKEEIDFFIKFCDKRAEIVPLFSSKRYLEVIDIFIKESENFKK